jgi:thiol-disulfide isomerase/thioredoxin
MAPNNEFQTAGDRGSRVWPSLAIIASVVGLALLNALLYERDVVLASTPAVPVQPNAGEMAQGTVHGRALPDEPVELQFVALDGRSVDLRELRGKVVLLEFWASWCPTCMRELPKLKSVYDEYHDQGFEIVGIALDDARDEQKLIALLRKEKVSWPQYFPGDGHYKTSDISRRFGVVGIPSAFLLDRQGVIADTHVRGKRLEPAVRKLLGQQP